MNDTDKQTTGGFHGPEEEGVWPGIDSRFRLVIVAAQRSKQLQRGARPRVEADAKRRRTTSIALEEVKRGLVPFINNTKESSGDAHAEPAEAAIIAG
jgi:DNA-directed RNA polymerase omega subunit